MLRQHDIDTNTILRSLGAAVHRFGSNPYLSRLQISSRLRHGKRTATEIWVALEQLYTLLSNPLAERRLMRVRSFFRRRGNLRPEWIGQLWDRVELWRMKGGFEPPRMTLVLKGDDTADGSCLRMQAKNGILETTPDRDRSKILL